MPGRFRHALAGSNTDIIEINTDDQDDHWLFCNREIHLRVKEEPTDEGDEDAATGEKQADEVEEVGWLVGSAVSPGRVFPFLSGAGPSPLYHGGEPAITCFPSAP